MGVFTTTDAAEIKERTINKLQDDVDEELYPGDERRIFGESVVGLFVAMYNTIDDTAKQSMLRYARGFILDLIGEGEDCERLQAQKATTTIKFSLKEVNSIAINIPKGTRVSTEDQHYFETDEDTTIAAGTLDVEVKATAIEGGNEYNGYLAGTVTQMVDQIAYINAATNLDTTQNGTDQEKDDDYRERIRLAPSKRSTAGPEPAWVYHTKTADVRIGDVKVDDPSENEIVITIMLEDGTIPEDEIVKKVEEEVSARDIRPLGDHVKVQKPTVKSYDIELKYYVSSEDERIAVQAIEQKEYTTTDGRTITGAIEAFRKWQDTRIGRDINPDKLKALIMNPAGDGTIPGASRVEITKPTYEELKSPQIAHYSGELKITHEVKDDE